MRNIFSSVFFFLLFFISGQVVFAYSSPGSPTGFVNDYANLFTAEQRQELEQKLSTFEQESTNEISVVTIPSLNGDTVEYYAEQLFQEWGIGKKEADNGVLLLIARDDRKIRIEVGYGLEGYVTDILASRIIRETLTPSFQREDFYGGTLQATEQIIALSRGLLPDNLQDTPRNDGIDFIFDFSWIFFFIFIWISSILARSKSWHMGGIIGALLALITASFLGSFFVLLIALGVFIPFGLFFDFIVSRAYQQSKKSGTRPPWWSGGGGFGGRSSSSFGGFGGGSSGGGGASGGW